MADWLNAVTTLLETREVKVTTQAIIPQALTEAYDFCYAKVIENGTNRLESEKAQYMYLYAIYSKKLWRAKYETWEEFLDHECHVNPLFPQKTSIKTAMTAIKELREKRVPLKDIATALVNAPTATRALPDVPQDKLPKGNYAVAVREIAEVDGGTALGLVNDWNGKSSIKCTEAFWDESNGRFLFKVKIRPPEIENPTIERDSFIADVDSADYAEWLMSRFRPATRKMKDNDGE